MSTDLVKYKNLNFASLESAEMMATRKNDKDNSVYLPKSPST